MKRIILLAVAGTAALVAAYLGPKLFAQGPGAPAASGQRIAVVNIGSVFSGYKKAELFKKELDDTLKPYRTQAEQLKSQIMQWEKAIREGKFSKEVPEERYKAGIIANKRKLEDLDMEARRLVGKRAEEQSVQLWKEVNEVIARTARGNGYNIILGYGDPPNMQANSVPIINRRMASMEAGSMTPLYFDGSADITQQVVDTLNRSYPGAAPAGGVPATPTSRPNTK